jgi:hypothetical protein
MLNTTLNLKNMKNMRRKVFKTVKMIDDSHYDDYTGAEMIHIIVIVAGAFFLAAGAIFLVIDIVKLIAKL